MKYFKQNILFLKFYISSTHINFLYKIIFQASMHTRYSRWSKSLHWLCLWSYHRRLCCSWMWIFMLGCVIQKRMTFLNKKNFFSKTCHDGCISWFICVYVQHFWNPKSKGLWFLKGRPLKLSLKKLSFLGEGVLSIA